MGHGLDPLWRNCRDIAQATVRRQLPDELATTVLEVSRGFVTDDLRKFAGFDPSIPVAADASPTDQLAAFLGQRP